MIQTQDKKRKIEKLYVYTDGGSRGNPGPAAIAVIICDKTNILNKYAEFIGKTTNNVAEYKALIKLQQLRFCLNQFRLKHHRIGEKENTHL